MTISAYAPYAHTRAWYGDQGTGTGQGGADVGELGGDVVGRGELGDGEGDSAGQGGHPGVAQAATAVHEPDQHQGHDERQQRRLTAHHGRHGVQGQSGHLGERDDRRAHRAEGHGRGVGDQGDDGGAHRFEAEGDQHDRADRDGSPEPGERLQQGPEAEGDDEGLDTRVIGQPPEGPAQDVEVPGADGHPVHPQGVDDDPQDGEEAEDGALCAAGEGLAERHPVGEPGDEDGGEEAGRTRQVRLHADAAE
jgi:hypothetical protein